MLKKTFFAATALVSVAFAGGAHAATLITFDEGVGGLQAGETLFADFDVTDGGVVGGQIQNVTNGDGARPAFGSTGNFLSVLGTPAGAPANEATFDFTGLGGLSQLGLDYGSADDYNTFFLTFNDGFTESYTGQQVIDIGNVANGDQQSAFTNGRLTFVADPGRYITGLRLTSAQNSLETDNYGILAAVPEPGTWAMLLIGFGGIGFTMRRRKSDSRTQRVRIAYS